jgi:hypothetical protein
MDSDSCKSEQNQECTQEKGDVPEQKRVSWNNKPDVVSPVFTAGIRRSIFSCNEANGFILDYGFFVLLPISTIVYSIFFIFS